MKNAIFLMLVLGFVSCAEKPMDVDQAKKVVEELITLTDKGDYEALEKLYTPAFNQSEPMEVKIEKLNRLKEMLGPVESVEFINSTHVAEFGQPKAVMLEYKVHHANVTTIEKFSVVEEEGGYRVSSHSVETQQPQG